MVNGTATALASSGYWAQKLDGIYAQILGMDPSGYGYDESDTWTRARLPGEWTRHLEAWVGLATTAELSPPSWVVSGLVTAGTRYIANDDSHSQSITLAAAFDLAEGLLSWCDHNSRIRRVGPIEVDPTGDGAWLTVLVPFELHISRG